MSSTEHDTYTRPVDDRLEGDRQLDGELDDRLDGVDDRYDDTERPAPGAFDELDDRPPAAKSWPRDDVEVTPASVGEPEPEPVATAPEPSPEVATATVADEPALADRTLIDDPEHVRQRWQSVQVGFVDDPRGAIDDAGKLVDEVVDLVVAGVAAQRDRLGESWSADDLDTEQLRLALRRYREFLDRLLAV